MWMRLWEKTYARGKLAPTFRRTSTPSPSEYTTLDLHANTCRLVYLTYNFLANILKILAHTSANLLTPGSAMVNPDLSYQYAPLESAEIRLLQLLSCNNADEPIRC